MQRTEQDHLHEIKIKFNNFPLALPGGLYRVVADDAILDLPFTELQRGDVGRFSKLRQQMTLRQFFERIDQACVARGIDLSQLESLQTERLQAGQDGRFEDKDRLSREFYAMIEPVFESLLEEGFSIIDVAS